MEDDNPTTHLISVALGIDYAVQAGRVIGVTVFPAEFKSGKCQMLIYESEQAIFSSTRHPCF